jgi:hypothetical protein
VIYRAPEPDGSEDKDGEGDSNLEKEQRRSGEFDLPSSVYLARGLKLLGISLPLKDLFLNY